MNTRAPICPTCLEPIAKSPAACRGCGTRYHITCRPGAGECPVAGCALSRKLPAKRVQTPERRPDARRAQILFGLAGLISGGVVMACEAFESGPGWMFALAMWAALALTGLGKRLGRSPLTWLAAAVGTTAAYTAAFQVGDKMGHNDPILLALLTANLIGTTALVLISAVLTRRFLPGSAFAVVLAGACATPAFFLFRGLGLFPVWQCVVGAALGCYFARAAER